MKPAQSERAKSFINLGEMHLFAMELDFFDDDDEETILQTLSGVMPALLHS